MSKQDERFHHSGSLESAMTQLCGSKSKWADSAGVFHSPSEVRKALQDAAKRFRQRLDEIGTADDRLLLTTNSMLNILEAYIKNYNENSNNEIDIIGVLLELTTFLLGYDWDLGKPNRQVIYYQTAEQAILDDKRRHPEDTGSRWYDFELEKRCEIIVNLHSEGLRVAQISRITNIPEAHVKNYLVRSGRISRKDNVKRTPPASGNTK